MLQNKIELRKHYLSIRRRITPQQKKRAALNARFFISRHSWFKTAKHIAFYWPNKSEISPLPLLKLALRLNKNCYLPRVLSGNSMTFHSYKNGDKLIRDPLGIFAPHPNKKLRPLKNMDLVIMPLVAFDKSGYRLGMGGGFYDRALEKCFKNPKRFGLAYSQQLAPQLPHEPWDIKLHAIATDKNLFTF